VTPEQYRAAIAKLDLSQVAAARQFKVAARTSRRWALGEARIPESVAMQLRTMIKHKIKPEDVK
jgi:hypothetical protein